jgi:inorganic pyrophosphatase
MKLKYDPALGLFRISRPLPLGVTYPFDWGFIPGTRASDGDPIDVMVLYDAGTFPGVVIACSALAVLAVEQNSKKGGRERNDRIIAAPVEARRPGAPLSPRARQELEAFFVSAVLLEKKDPTILGWGSADEAEALVERSKAAA